MIHYEKTKCMLPWVHDTSADELFLVFEEFKGTVVRPSRKHTYIILTPSNPTFIVKLGFTGVYFIFLISAQKHRL